jgi:hypothetical protein
MAVVCLPGRCVAWGKKGLAGTDSIHHSPSFTGCRLKDAHGQDATLDWSNPEAVAGMFTNYSLTMLGSCVRALLEHKARKGKSKGKFSTRAFLGDLVPLLQESMTGEACSACFICVSQAPANTSQSRFSLDFGETFAKLKMKPRAAPPTSRSKLVQAAAALLQEADRCVRQGLCRMCVQLWASCVMRDVYLSLSVLRAVRPPRPPPPDQLPAPLFLVLVLFSFLFSPFPFLLMSMSSAGIRIRIPGRTGLLLEVEAENFDRCERGKSEMRRSSLIC